MQHFVYQSVELVLDGFKADATTVEFLLDASEVADQILADVHEVVHLLGLLWFFFGLDGAVG